MPDSNALAKAKKQAVLDATLTINIADQEAPAQILLNQYLREYDFNIYNNTIPTINISSFSEGTDDFKTLCQCATISDVQYLQENSEITIVTTPINTTYNGTYRIKNLDITAFKFEIQKIFTVTRTATATITRKTTLELAHAYFILFFMMLSAQELVNKQVLYSSNSFGEGQITQASLETKKIQADEYMRKAMQVLDYFTCEVI